MQTVETSEASSPGPSPIRPLVPLYAGEFLLFVANSIAFTAIATRAVAAGLDSAVVGTAGSAFFAGLFAVYLAGPALVRGAGLRALVLAAAPITLAGLSALAVPSASAWILGRFAMGLGTALLIVAIENWITLAIGKDARGRALALYMAVYLASYVAGQSVLLAVAPTSVAAFWIAGASLAIGFAAFVAAAPPVPPPQPRLPRGGAAVILRQAPLAVAATLASGLAAGAFYALGPVYAIRIGVAPDRAPGFMILVVAGSSIAQVALGIASDRFDRARLLLAVQVLALGASLGLFLAEAITATVLALALLWGSTAPLGYATAAAMVYDGGHGRPPREVAQVVLVANGVGGMLGPALAAALDDVAPGKGLFALSVAVFAALAATGLASGPRKPRRGGRSSASR